MLKIQIILLFFWVKARGGSMGDTGGAGGPARLVIIVEVSRDCGAGHAANACDEDGVTAATRGYTYAGGRRGAVMMSRSFARVAAT